MDQTFSNVENSGISYPQDFYINKLNLITSSGAIELKKVLVELSYYEDLFSFVVSGHLSVVDGQGFIEILQLDGNEFLEMDFSKVRGGSSISGKYRVYKIGDRIAQIIILPYPKVLFREVDELSSTERGEGGFGSTTTPK